MDFALPPELDAIRRRVRDFVQDRLIPLEADRASYDEHENISPALLKTLRDASSAPPAEKEETPDIHSGKN